MDGYQPRIFAIDETEALEEALGRLAFNYHQAYHGKEEKRERPEEVDQAPETGSVDRA